MCGWLGGCIRILRIHKHTYIHTYTYIYIDISIYKYIHIHEGEGGWGQPNQKNPSKRNISLSLAELKMYQKNIHKTRQEAGGFFLVCLSGIRPLAFCGE